MDHDDRLDLSIRSPKTVLFIGFDAMDMYLATDLADRGDMPNLARLLEASPKAKVNNPVGFVVGGIWPSLRTGRWPGRHGRHCYVQLKPGTYDFVPVEPDSIDGIHVWGVVGQHGHPIFTMDVPFSSPVPNVPGIQLVDWGSHDRCIDFTTVPDTHGKRIIDDHGAHPVDTFCDDFFRADRLRDLRDGLLAGAVKRTDIVLDELANADVQLAVVVYGESHCAGHQFWKVHDTEYAEHDAGMRTELGDPVVDVYRALDAELGRLLEAKPDALTYVYLSHGMGPHHDGDHLLPEILRRLDSDPRTTGREVASRLIHRTKAILRPFVPHRLRRARFARAKSDLSRRVVDDRATRRFFHHVNNTMYSGVRFNLEGREPQGKVRAAQVDALTGWLVQELESLVEPDTGRGVVDRVLRVADLYDGEHVAELPDLVVDWNRDEPISQVTSAAIGTVTGRYASTRSGDHRLDGMLLVTGPGSESARFTHSVDVVDVAPTIAAHFGVTLDDIDGAPIPGLGSVRIGGSTRG